ncbi:hypothetical protein ACFY41_29230 [Streptomyces syringium]|uniref:hypothetical protein n=1 Tax=Streptomyces syringium TaxID=76729 RepID=UPI0036C0A99C
MTTTLRVYASYHQFNLFDTDAEDDDLTEDDPSGGNGLVRVNAAGDYVTVNTGVQNGYVRLDYDVLDSEPPLADHGWDEVVETSVLFSAPGAGITSPEDDGDVAGLQGEGVEYGIGLPGPEDEPRWWRMRFHARGRDDSLDAPAQGEDVESTEQYLILAWPAPKAPETCHKATDRAGAHFRTGN